MSRYPLPTSLSSIARQHEFSLALHDCDSAKNDRPCCQGDAQAAEQQPESKVIQQVVDERSRRVLAGSHRCSDGVRHRLKVIVTGPQNHSHAGTRYAGLPARQPPCVALWLCGIRRVELAGRLQPECEGASNRMQAGVSRCGHTRPQVR